MERAISFRDHVLFLDILLPIWCAFKNELPLLDWASEHIR